MRPIDKVEKQCTFCHERGLRHMCDLQKESYYGEPCFERHEKVCPKAEEVREELHRRDLEEVMSWDNYGGG